MMVQKPEMIEKFMKINKYGRPGTKRSKTTKIAWHFTGQHDVPAKNTVSYFSNVVANGYKVNGKYIYASSHYVMGLEGEIYYIVPETEIAYTTNSANAYSIGVECATTGVDDHYTDEEYKSMVKLGAYLACKYKLDPRKDFIRHYDVTGRICPRYFVNNVKAWEQFKLDCYNYLNGLVKEKDIVNCTNGKGKVTKVTTVATNPTKKQYVKILIDGLNIHKTADFKAESVCGTVPKGGLYTVAEEITDTGCSTHMYKLKSGVYITASKKYVQLIEK